MTESTQNWVTFTDAKDGKQTLIDLNSVQIYLIIRSEEIKKTMIQFTNKYSKRKGSIIVNEMVEEILEILQPKIH